MSSYKTQPLEANPVAGEKQPTRAPALAQLEGSPTMRHKVNLTLGNLAQREKLISLRIVSLRERITRFLLGDKQKYTLVVPSDSTEEGTIIQKQDDDLSALADAAANPPGRPQEHLGGSMNITFLNKVIRGLNSIAEGVITISKACEDLAWEFVEDHAGMSGARPITAAELYRPDLGAEAQAYEEANKKAKGTPAVAKTASQSAELPAP